MDSAPSQTYPDDIDIAMLWRAVARNKGRLLFAVLLAGAATYGTMAQIRPSYLSRAEVLVERDESAYTRPKGEQAPVAEAPRFDENEMASQVQVIVSRDLLLGVVNELDLTESEELNPALAKRGLVQRLIGLMGFGGPRGKVSAEEGVLDTLSERLLVYPVAKSRVIAIDMIAHDPELAARVSNSVAKAYIAFNTQGLLRQDTEASDWLGGQIDELRKAAETAETDLERYRAQAGLLSSLNNVTLSTQQLTEINTQLTQARAQRTDAESRARLIRDMLARGEVDASPEVLKSSLVQRLIEQQSRVERQIAELSATLLSGHPRMRQLYSELRSVNTQLRNEALKVVKSLENEVKVAAARQAALEATLGDLTRQMEQSSEAQARLRVLEREALSRRAVYETYLDRLNDARTRRDRPVSNAFARMISTAVPSSIPVSPRKVPATLLAMLGTLLAGLALIVTRELVFASRGGYRVPSSSGMHAPAPAASVPGAAFAASPARSGAKPMRPPVRLGSVAAVAQHLATRAQSIPGYRTMLTGEAEATPVAEEALAIARRLAAAGRKAVLVDWCVGDAGPAAGIGVGSGPGLEQLVAGTATFEDVLHLDPKSTLHVIVRGKSQPGAEVVAEGEQLSLVLDALDEIYHHVILCGRRSEVGRLFELVQGRFDAGVIVRDQGSARPVAEERGFLGFDVPELEVVLLERPGGVRQAALRRAPAGEQATSA